MRRSAACKLVLIFSAVLKIVWRNIEDSLVDINDFIVIAERSPKMDHKLMKLLEKLKDDAYDAQDLLEEYAIEDRRRSEVA
ncbi:hypothetical protein MRB53_009472 [Persea americana]|uniref:Uncharacterized protein n=1 Tax=Persea americana TaxID=3435 RepID=A0ACC2LP34_PERAE|nr:hypothetical protein MRB53_009472 [Persea americana]